MIIKQTSKIQFFTDTENQNCKLFMQKHLFCFLCKSICFL